MPIGTSTGKSYDDQFDLAVDTFKSEETEQQSISNFFGRLFGGGEKPIPIIKGDAPTSYPTNEDADFAKQHGFAYGKDWENFFNDSAARVMGYDFIPKDKKGKPVPSQARFATLTAEGLNTQETIDSPSKVLDLNDPKFIDIKEKLKNNYAKAALAVNRDPIASLGFSPNKVTMDVDLVRPGESATIGGLYSKDKDQIYSNLSSHSNIVHESIHRGLEQLFQRNPEAAKTFKEMHLNEEYIVRHIMDTVMGNPEEGLGSLGDKQIKDSRYFFNESVFAKEHQRQLKTLQDLAIEEIAKKHPGGPR